MLGAIAGDVIGSVFEFSGLKTTNFPLFCRTSTYTDDSVLTAAVAATLLDHLDLAQSLRRFGRFHPGRGYGSRFQRWLDDDTMGPYHSWGNGSAMRASPVGWAFDDVDEVLRQACRSAEVTHDHPEGVRGAQAVALSVFVARKGADKSEIRAAVETRCGYELARTVEEIRPIYRFDESCQGSVPESIICFLESHDYESSVRLAISLGGDADTMACIAGGIAEAHYGGVPDGIAREVLARLTPDLLHVIRRFRARYCGAAA